MSVSPQELRTRRQASGTPGTPRTLGQVELGELYRYGVIHYSGDQSLVRAENLHHLISSSPSIGTDLSLKEKYLHESQSFIASYPGHFAPALVTFSRCTSCIVLSEHLKFIVSVSQVVETSLVLSVPRQTG